MLTQNNQFRSRFNCLPRGSVKQDFSITLLNSKITSNIQSIDQFLINTDLLLQQQNNYQQGIYQYREIQIFNKENSYQQHQIEESKRFKTEVSDVNISFSNITFKQFLDYPTSLCIKHNLKEEYFCQDHNTQLCLSCISTKSHGNHKIIEIGELNKRIAEAKQQAETTFKIVREKNRLLEQETQKSFQDLQNALVQKKKETIQSIEFKFQDLYHRLKTIENIQVQQVNVLTFKVEEHIRIVFANSSKKIQESLNEFQKKMDLAFQNDQLGQLLAELNKLPNYGLELLKLIDFTDEKQKLNQMIKENFLIEYNEIEQAQLERVCLIKSPQLKSSNPFQLSNFKMIKSNENKNQGTQKKSSEYMQYSKNTHFHDRSTRKKGVVDKKSRSLESRVFERLKKMLLNGMNIDKFDASNQEITDEDVIELCGILLESKSDIDTVKLTKNRITDVGFASLLKCLSQKKNIHTLNLTGNLCTAKSIELIDNQLKAQNIWIKNLYLTNCKINPNKYLQEQQRIIQAGVNLYL